MHRTALLLVDVINDMDFEGSESLVRQAEPMAHRLKALKHRARAAGLPTIYINDNFGKWRSDFRTPRRALRQRRGARPGRGAAAEAG